MNPETENPQKAKSVYPGKPARHAQADPVGALRRVHNVCFLAGRLNYDVAFEKIILQLCYATKIGINQENRNFFLGKSLLQLILISLWSIFPMRPRINPFQIDPSCHGYDTYISLISQELFSEGYKLPYLTHISDQYTCTSVQSVNSLPHILKTF